ncbi:ubiquinone biosynthesis O-methyltransferase [mine drainage metagenome]|uniref:Ubiquinone biosynthesis O-methyltransferase n=1 Tax=mine drainage metagenome TaxID=410659 RepID=A0A1J5QW50_9ZZZZ
MDKQEHWEKVYREKAPDAVSWYRPHLERSIELIERAAPDRSAAIIDVGGGESTLVDDLLRAGYRDVSVLDISAAAIAFAQRRLGAQSAGVTWWADDVTQADLPPRRYDVWHDRAVFHFLTEPEQRAAYVRQVARAVKPGGHVIVATFGPEGPLKCSGLDVVRYDADALHGQFGAEFRLIESQTEIHETPSGSRQQFLYCFCKLVASEGC